MSQGQKRPYEQVLPIATHILDTISPFCTSIEIAGSLRRKRPLVGDIELCAIPRRPLVSQGSLFDQEPKIDYEAETDLCRFLDSKIKEEHWFVNGRKQKAFLYRGLRVDLFLPRADNWGWRYMLATGSGDFNKWLVTNQQTGWGAMPRDMRSDHGWLQRSVPGYGWLDIITPTETAVFPDKYVIQVIWGHFVDFGLSPNGSFHHISFLGY